MHLRVAQDSSDGGSSGSRAWITSPMAKYVSTFNGHMIWFIVSTLLSGLGSYNKKGVYFVATPDRKSAYSEAGLQGGVVTGGMHGAKHYQVRNTAFCPFCLVSLLSAHTHSRVHFHAHSSRACTLAYATLSVRPPQHQGDVGVGLC